MYGFVSCITVRTLNYGSYGTFLFMSNAGFISSAVSLSAFGGLGFVLSLGHFQVGSYRYRSLIEGLYTL